LTQIHEAFKFYDERYDGLGQWMLEPGKLVFLGDRNNRQCRFCGKKFPDVTFSKDAHVIPEQLGNKSLFSYYECDKCNEFFGTGIENDFGNWSKPMRTLNRIKGKKGVPKIKKTDTGWCIDGVPHGLEIKQKGDDPAFEIDLNKEEMTFRLTRDPYTPIAVRKALVKMGLTLLPEDELSNFHSALDWVQTKNYSIGRLLGWPIIQTIMPGAYRSDLICLLVFRRKLDDLDVPYAFFILTYGNEMFQVFIPSPERDKHIKGKELKLYRFPSILDFYPSDIGLPQVALLDLTSGVVVRKDTVTSVLSFDEVTYTTDPNDM